MTPDQQHDIRNGVCVIYRIARHLARCENLGANQKMLARMIQQEAMRIGRSVEAKPGAFDQGDHKEEQLMNAATPTTATRTWLIPALIFSLAAVLLALMLPGCAGSLQNLGARPPGCEQSIIYDTIPAPKIVGAGIIIATGEALARYPKAIPFILGAIDKLSLALEDDSLTYLELATMATDHIKWINGYFGSRLVLYTSLLAAFDRPVPIQPCDRALIRSHLEKQKAALSAMGVSRP